MREQGQGIPFQQAAFVAITIFYSASPDLRLVDLLLAGIGRMHQRGTSDTVVNGGSINEIRTEFPEVKTILREMSNDEQYRDLIEQKIDIGFATNPLVPENLKSKVFFEDMWY